jgi:hypothetical protein
MSLPVFFAAGFFYGFRFIFLGLLFAWSSSFARLLRMSDAFGLRVAAHTNS